MVVRKLAHLKLRLPRLWNNLINKGSLMTPEFYIINDVDRPDQRHVCQTINKDNLEYIHHDLKNWNADIGYPFTLTYNKQATNLLTFGFDITIKKGKAEFTKVRSSRAKYKDGTHRPWQGSTIFTLDLKPMDES
jgi:hypothetical protein